MQHPTNIVSPMSRRTIRILVAAVGVALVGCGHAACMLELRHAARLLDNAHALHADESAPYEYYYALAHYEKAHSEAAEADYGDALELAGTSTEYAARAVELSRATRRANP